MKNIPPALRIGISVYVQYDNAAEAHSCTDDSLVQRS